MTFLNRFFNPCFWAQFLGALKKTIERFPLPVFAGIGLFCLVVFQIHHSFDSYDPLFRMMLSLGFAMVWFTLSRLCSENMPLSRTKEIFIFGVLYAFLIWQGVWCFEVLVRFETFFLMTAGGAIALMFAPYLSKRNDDASVWFYNYQLFVALFFSTTAALILCGGLSIILVSIGYLFELDIQGEIYADIWSFGYILFAPVYFLSHLPKEFSWQRTDCAFPVGIRFIQRFVLVPLALVYMAVLYAYFVKIGLKWEMPRGHLGWMISSFGVIGIVTYLMIYPLHDKEGKLLGWFYKNFFVGMIVPILLLAVAIFLRIEQYGITLARYAVVFCLIWFLVLTVWRVVFAKYFYLKWIPMILAGLFFIASMGPLSAYHISMNSQMSRLVNILQKSGHLTAGGLYQKTSDVMDFKQRKEVSNIIEYLNKLGGLEQLRPWFDDKGAFDKIFLDSEGNAKNQNPKRVHYGRRYNAAREVMDLLAIPYVSRWQKDEPAGFEIIVKHDIEQGQRAKTVAQDILGYRYIVHVGHVSLYSKKDTKNVTIHFPKVKQYYTIGFHSQGIIQIKTSDGRKLFDADMKDFTDRLVKKASDNVLNKPLAVPQIQMMLDQKTEAFGKVRFSFEKIKGIKKTDGDYQFKQYNVWVLFEKLPATDVLSP